MRPQLAFQKRQPSRLHALAWSPDSALLASGATFRKNATSYPVTIWDIAAGERIGVYRGLTSPASVLAWSPDGDTLAAAAFDQSIQIWDWHSGKQLRQVAAPGAEKGWLAAMLAWSPDGGHLATTSISCPGEIRIYETSDWQIAQRVMCAPLVAPDKRYIDTVRQLAWSPDGSRLAAVASDETIQICAPLRGVEICRLQGGQEVISSWCCWSPDGRYLAVDASTSDRKAAVHIWDLGAPESAPAAHPNRIQTIQGQCNAIGSIWRPAGEPPALAMVAGNRGATVYLYQPFTGECLCAWSVHWAPGMTWSPDGRYLACGSGRNLLQVWSL